MNQRDKEIKNRKGSHVDANTFTKQNDTYSTVLVVLATSTYCTYSSATTATV